MADLLTDNSTTEPEMTEYPLETPDEAAEDSATAHEADTAGTSEPAMRSFEDLSLGEMVFRLLQRPGQTIQALTDTLHREPVNVVYPVTESASTYAGRRSRQADTEPFIPAEAVRSLRGIGAALLLAIIGSLILTSSRGQTADRNLIFGGSLLLLGAIIMGVIVVRAPDDWRLPAPVTPPTTWKARSLEDYALKYGIRAALGFLAIIWTFGAWSFNAHNAFTGFGVFCWVMAAVTWFVVLYEGAIDAGAVLSKTLEGVRNLFTRTYSFRLNGTFAALIVILLIGASLRFTGLGTYPPEMTSDHVEKALDAQRVYEGNRQVFFPNNGGREGFQMYYLAVLKAVTGMDVGLVFLQIGSGLEGMVMILLAFWMGRALIGEEDHQLGNLTGLIMAALIASSFWHVLLSRLGLRIVTTTLVATVVFVFLVRALRYNRRLDFLITGVALGAGMYFYQAARMLPLVVIAGFVLAVALRARSRRDLGRYVLNMVALVIISLAVFAPLGRYMVEYPREFWERTTGRLFGEEGLRDPAVGLQNFQKNLPGLADNFGRSMLMFNFRGDMSWFNGAPDGTPELDFFTGALFLLGLGLIIARAVRRRDPGDWLLPVSILIMLLPAALSIAYSIEVPSLTRASGSLPMVYFLAAFALAYILRRISDGLPRRSLRNAVYALTIVLILIGTLQNTGNYFSNAMADYRDSTLPHKQAGTALRGFIDSTGAPGNAFLPAFANWWDYRALGIEAGDPHWGNIIWRDPSLQDNFYNLIRANIGTKYEIQPDRQMLFFMDPQDIEFAAMLQTWFPNGLVMKVSAYKPSRDYLMEIVPPVGCDWVVQKTGVTPDSCKQKPLTPTPGSNSVGR